MKKISTNIETKDNQIYLEKVTNRYIEELKEDRDRKKKNEVFHVGKFLMLYRHKLSILNLREEPDFILTDGKRDIGLEHQIVIHEKSKRLEGFFKNICRQAEAKLLKEYQLSPFLANIFFNPNQKPKINQKSEIVEIICQLVSNYVNTGHLIENEIIDHIFSMDHKVISLQANMGAWFQKRLDKNILSEAIRKKERNVEKYISNTSLPQWLLLIIGGVGDSSYTYEEDFDITVTSKFEKIFLLEDMYYNLFEIK